MKTVLADTIQDAIDLKLYEVTLIARVYAKNPGSAIVFAGRPEVERTIKDVREIKS